MSAAPSVVDDAAAAPRDDLAESAEAYIPDDRRRALAAGVEIPDRVRGAALFADISGFTPLTEALGKELGPQRGAEELTAQLNRVFHALVEELHRFGGHVIYFSGDAITCWMDGLAGRIIDELAAAKCPPGRIYVSEPVRRAAGEVCAWKPITPMRFFSSAGVYLSRFGTSGIGNEQFLCLRGIAIDPTSHNIVTADSCNDRVQKFRPVRHLWHWQRAIDRRAQRCDRLDQPRHRCV
jgi:hypothetical protein